MTAAHHRVLLLQAQRSGADAMPMVLDLLVKRKGYDVDAMRIKMGVLKVVMSFLASTELLDILGVSHKVAPNSASKTLPRIVHLNRAYETAKPKMPLCFVTGSANEHRTLAKIGHCDHHV